MKVQSLTTLDYLDSGLQQALVDYAATGGTVVIGPRVPRFDSLMRPCAILADAVAAKAPRIVLVESSEEVASTMIQACGQAGVALIGRSDPRLDVIVHGDTVDEGRKVVFVINPTADHIEAAVAISISIQSASELWTGEPVRSSGDSIAVSMAPYSIHIYECRTA